VRRGDLGGVRRPRLDELEAVAGVRGREHVRGGDGRHAVARHDRDEHGDRRARGEQPGDAGQHGVVAAEHAAQERRPREVDGHRRRPPVQRSRRVLGRGDREQRVGEGAAARRTARGGGHRGRARVDADHERVRARGGRGQHVAAVTRAEVDRDPRMARGEPVESAVVALEEGAALQRADHAGTVPGAPMSFAPCAGRNRASHHEESP
jgi:hypothetical protein